MEFVCELVNVGNNALGVLEQLIEALIGQRYDLVELIIKRLVEAVNADIMREIEAKPQVVPSELTKLINAYLQNLFEGHSFKGGVPRMVAKDIHTAMKWIAILQFLLDQKPKGGISIGDVKQDKNTLVVEATTVVPFEYNTAQITQDSTIVASQLRGLMVSNGSDGTPSTATRFHFRFYPNQSGGYSLVPIDESQQTDSKLQLTLNCLTRHDVIAERNLDELTFDEDEGWRPVRKDDIPQSKIRSPGTLLDFNAQKLHNGIKTDIMAVLGIDHTYEDESIKIDSVGRSITKAYGEYESNRSITMPGEIVSGEDSDEGMTSQEAWERSNKIVTPEGW